MTENTDCVSSVRRAAVVLTVGWVTGLAATAWAQGEAFVGEPFGVGLVTLAMPAGQAAAAADVDGFALVESRGRALYPVFSEGRVLRLLGEILGDAMPVVAPDVLNVLFLFPGDQPLDLTVYTPAPRQYRVTPRRAPNPRAHQRLLQRWWREYSAAARRQTQDGDYPPIVQTYLSSMFSRRLGVEPLLLDRIAESAPSEPLRTFQLVTGAEQLRLQTLRQTNLTGYPTGQAADRPVPAEIAWQPLEPPAADEQVEIEPLAMRVPEECFYIRFGSFLNYLWVENLQREYGEDLDRMITLRGFDDRSGERMQRQLALDTSPLADLLGPAAIADVALIGRDLFLREGAAVGMLFQARNSPLLARDLIGQRAAALKAERDRGATMQIVQVNGREVSLLSTPDNRLRSYYVVDGDYHLVTTSRAIVERFLEVGDGGASLGASREFRHARSMMPTRRQDTVFIFFSSAFQQGLLSPQYQVELRRRLHAATDLELVQLAQWAARAEGRPAETIDDLVRGQYLPPGFGRRPDGSEPTESDGQWVDSLRGPRSSMTPIPDVTLTGVTRDEAARFDALRQYAATSWPQMDPIIVGIRRFALDRPEDERQNGERLRLERLVIDAHLSPFDEQKYGWLTSLLGPPTGVRIQPAEGDIITAQAAVKGGLVVPGVSPHHLFLGIQDAPPLAESHRGGLFQTLMVLRTTPGYLGAWPKPGFLDVLPWGLGGGPPDAAGYSQLPLGVYRRQWDAFSALAFDPRLLAEVTPQLAVTEADNDAQVRVRVGDISRTQLQSWVNSLAYARARQASLGNVKLLHALSQQLGVPRADALQAAAELLDAKLVCALGGQDRVTETPGGLPLWSSDRWPEHAAGATAEDYRAPLLEWFRGLEADLTMYGDRVVLHATLDMQRKVSEPKLKLPSFRGLFGGGRPGAEGKKSVAPPPAAESPPEPEVIPPPPEEPPPQQR